MRPRTERAPGAVTMLPRRRRWWIAPVAMQLATVGFVAVLLTAGDTAGLPVGAWVATAVTVCLTLSAAVMLAEVACSRAPQPPPAPPGPYPDATAIVAAYLPNEQHHLLATIDHLLALPYAGHLQVICAYNTPHRLPIEQALRSLARAQPRFAVMSVADSTSKADNVNAAMSVATGRIVAIFDADHHPEPGCFERAWRWLAGGYDVVQGSCSVRDGHRGALARTVAAEFDGMYCVTHTGRARVQGFAIFGGSNGYWRRDALESTGLDPTMLTEDIDASIRGIAAGLRIVADPAVVSTELAPATVRALWTQRLRWAQGWTQVSRRRLADTLASPRVGWRTRAGLVWQFGWCEVLPWVSTVGLGMLVQDAVSGDWRWSTMAASLAALNLAVGPVLALAGLIRAPLAHTRSWYALYALVSAVAYVEILNTAKRAGHLRELSGRRSWVVTARPVPVAAANEPVAA